MKMIVGLGNPGKQYEKTRHNMGFMVLEELCKKLEIAGDFKFEKKFEAEICQEELFGEKIIFVKPMTFMNLSGNAVGEIASFYKIDINNIWIIHDDLDLPFGQIRVRKGGRSGGHNGVESIVERFKSSDILRIKIGIGRPVISQYAAEKYVLEPFSKEEEGGLADIISKSVEILKEGLSKGNLDNDSVSII